ncbi:carboxymuconolactone decarboxylase family protein [Agrobacterium sp. ICMP 6402]|uniref:carboxymuconolactone decarboxylase family protein n=1 Tax=Agrobacterium sp. ICMP 6402 TaxID=2292443 RepID=UPI001294AF41|nr:carboxymuconolactone decarboxylase family protein [Agrobacterium sp. ICMP 6402]MQB08780.1 carboxymuconolactone decarboxylase family protein [Agrobacterium sp. ICMP 6402]
MTDMSRASASFQRFMTDAPAHSAAWLHTVQKLGVASTLDVKTQSLIYIGILAALRLESGIAFHVMEAKARGASRDDIISAVLTGLPAAGNGVVSALGPALDAFDGV